MLIRHAMRLVAVFVAMGLAALGGDALRGPAQLQAQTYCENDYCDDGWFWDSCESGTDKTDCDMLDSNSCITFMCADTE